MLGGDEQDIANALPGDAQVGDNQWLRENIAIHRLRKEPGEIRRGNVRRSENRLIGILSRAKIVIVISQNADRRNGWSHGPNIERNQKAGAEQEQQETTQFAG